MDLPEVSNDVKEGMSLKLWKVDFLKDFFRNCIIFGLSGHGVIEGIVAEQQLKNLYENLGLRIRALGICHHQP